MNNNNLESSNSTLTAKQTEEKPAFIQKENPAMATAAFFSGPIPPPHVLIEYDKLVPGIAKKFLENPLLESEHRRSLQRIAMDEQINLSKRGQWMAFVLAIFCLIGAFSAIFLGFNITGLTAFVLSLASFVGIFIYSKNNQNNQSPQVYVEAAQNVDHKGR